MKKVKCYQKNAKYLDTKKLGIDLVSADETFVALDDYPGYYISSEGRVVNGSTKRILKPQICSPSKIKYLSYRLPHKKNGYKSILAHKLVAKYFVRPRRKSNGQVETHHINGNSQDNSYKNLCYMDADEHRAINHDVYLYDIYSGHFKRFKTLSRLCEYTKIDPKAIRREIYYRLPDFSYFNGLEGYILDQYYNGFPALIGIRRHKGNDNYKTLYLEKNRTRKNKLVNDLNI